MHRIAFLSLLISAAATAADRPAPPLHFEAGVVLAGGYVLARTVTLPPVPGPVTLPTHEGTALHWRVTVQDGETQLLQQDGHWAARAEYSHAERAGHTVRSEEHTSELQSLMRLSYAVFCLKKTKKTP